LGFGVWGLGFRVWGLGLGFGGWGLGFGGLGFGVWGLGVGGWGLEFGVKSLPAAVGGNHRPGLFASPTEEDRLLLRRGAAPYERGTSSGFASRSDMCMHPHRACVRKREDFVTNSTAAMYFVRNAFQFKKLLAMKFTTRIL